MSPATIVEGPTDTAVRPCAITRSDATRARDYHRNMLVVVDYGMGNVGSVLNMLRRVGSEPMFSSNPAVIAAASKLVLSGVGAFDTGMRQLAAAGVIDALNEAVLGRGVPVIGLCLGMHLLTEGSEEGQLQGLGWIPGRTVRFRFDPSMSTLKVPHMGWNTINVKNDAPIVRDLLPGSRFYFVHSYHVECEDQTDVAATTEHGYAFPSIVQRANIIGTQFHPEKSHRFGKRLLERFLAPV